MATQAASIGLGAAASYAYIPMSLRVGGETVLGYMLVVGNFVSSTTLSTWGWKKSIYPYVRDRSFQEEKIKKQNLSLSFSLVSTISSVFASAICQITGVIYAYSYNKGINAVIFPVICGFADGGLTFFSLKLR